MTQKGKKMTDYIEKLEKIAALVAQKNLQEEYTYKRVLTLMGFKQKVKYIQIVDKKNDRHVATIIPDVVYSYDLALKQIEKY